MLNSIKDLFISLFDDMSLLGNGSKQNNFDKKVRKTSPSLTILILFLKYLVKIDPLSNPFRNNIILSEYGR